MRTINSDRPKEMGYDDFMSNIDLSYKQDALRVTYDLESTPNLFTSAMIHDNGLSLMFFGDQQFSDLTDDELRSQMIDFGKKPDTLTSLKKQSYDELDYTVMRYHTGDAESIRQLSNDLLTILTCQPLKQDAKYATNPVRFTEYAGWNSYKYDLSLMVLIKLAADVMKEKLTPQYIRELSNLIIRYDGPPWGFANYVEAETAGAIQATMYKMLFNLAVWSDGHIDWAKVAKSDESGNEALLPPGLKKEMARFGMDIIIDESVADNNEKIWTDEERRYLVEYNFNDVLGTKDTGHHPALEGGLITRDIVREMYPYTSAKHTPVDKLNRWTPPERDATAANIAGLVLIGPRRIKPKDWDAVSYTFPVPDPKNPGQTKTVDLLEHINETEEFVHPYFNEFFGHFRGKDTSRLWDDMQVKAAQPVTHQSTMNLPYYKDGKPIDCYIRVSTGGAHGSVMAGLRNKTEEEVRAWIKTDPALKLNEKPTIDMVNILHADWSSFYPVMASKMKLYETSEGQDRYSGIINYRFKLKDRAGELWQAGLADTEEYHETQDLQMGLKFVLNNATGAGNTHNKYALLPVDNKTLSMRLVGNMLIWALGQRLAQAGAFIISTNTDGLYFSNLSMETAQQIIDGYIEDYGMDVDPEPINRMINRDTSNRIEYHGNDKDPENVTNPSTVGGILRHGTGLKFNDGSIGQNVTYPLIAVNAVLHYMKDLDWLTKPYDESVIRDYITSIAQSGEHIHAWYHVYVGSNNRRLLVDGQLSQRINRVVFTKNGSTLTSQGNRKLSQADGVHVWNQLVEGVDPKDITHEDGTPVQFSGFFKDVIESGEFTLDNLDFGKKAQNEEKVDFYVPRGQAKEVITLQEFKDQTLRLDANGKAAGKDLIYFNEKTGLYDVIKAWKFQAITGYTSNIGEVLNTAEELRNFDHSNLDIDAYVRWAENILDNWKVTGDIPQIGLEQCDDKVVKVAKKVRVTRKSQEIDVIRRMYGLEELSGKTIYA